MDKVKFGILGIGHMGIGHFNNFIKGKIENGIVTAVSDISQKRLDEIQEKMPGDYKVYTSSKELIEKADVDAVIIAVPHYDHPNLVIKALNRGLHVLCEKPAGVYTKHVREMNEVADRSNKIFSLMYNQRTNPLYIKMHDIIASGELGTLRRVNWIITNWFRTQFYFDSGSWRATWKGEGGGVLMNQCPHQIDLLQWIVGEMPNKIHSHCHFGKWHDIEVEDDVTAYMEFPSGATGCFIASTGDAPGSNRLEILCSKGRLLCENDKLIIHRHKEDLQDYIKTCDKGSSAPECEVEVVEQDYKRNTQHVGIINNFANAILGIEELYVKGQEGINCVELINAMLLSSFKNKEVTLPIDDDEYFEELSKRIKTSRLKEGSGVVLDTSSSYGGTK